MNKSERNLNKIKEEKLIIRGEGGLKNLNIEPLSIAKFFYEKGAKNTAIIQRLIYLAFLKVLKENDTLLFDKEWQAWSGGPVVESVFKKMSNYFDKHGSNYEKLFANVSDVDNKEILPYLEGTYYFYQIHEKSKEEYKIFQMTYTRPWEMVRRNLRDELEHPVMNLSDIIDYVNEEKNKSKVARENISSLFNLFEIKKEASEYKCYAQEE